MTSSFQSARNGGRARTIESAQNPRDTVKRLLGYFLPFKTTLILMFILVVINTVTTVAGPFLMGYAIDQFIAAGKLDGLLRISLLMLVLYLINWVTQAGSAYLTAGISQKALKALRKQLFDHLQSMSIRFFDQNPHGELMSRLTNDIDAINQAISQNIIQLFSSILTLAGVIIAMFLLNVWLALTTMVAIPMMLWLVSAVTRHTRKSFRSLQNQIGNLNGLMEENISGLREVKIFHRNQTAMETFDTQNQLVCDSAIKAQTLAFLLMPLMTVLSNLNIAIVAGVGSWMAIQGWASIGNIASFISYTRTFAQPLRQVSNLINAIQAAIAGAERIFDILDHHPELTDDSHALPFKNVKGDVQFKNVNFAYIEGQPIIKNMNIHAQPGEMIALVGPTGAGKTTLVNLLSRFYNLHDGEIKIDGINIQHIKQADLRQQLGIVLQDAFLFSTSVIENIRYGRLDASDEACFEAAKIANADFFIRRLPQGYNTQLSERGSNLSQGQRQLLTIARAVLADPAILVLDEATSSVDTRTEIRIQQALQRLMKGRTSFVIAHRLSTIRNADQVLVINHGEIIEQGNHTELLAAKGFYHDLYYSQFKGTLPQDLEGNPN
ncbi:MAG: multidrug ABC transporter ATP-binding protein [Anaerolineaceae bacterium]|nr:multidrug ABC transporter ATP-binding protein [Anaerolineaceae bacterium]